MRLKPLSTSLLTQTIKCKKSTLVRDWGLDIEIPFTDRQENKVRETAVLLVARTKG